MLRRPVSAPNVCARPCARAGVDQRRRFHSPPAGDQARRSARRNRVGGAGRRVRTCRGRRRCRLAAHARRGCSRRTRELASELPSTGRSPWRGTTSIAPPSRSEDRRPFPRTTSCCGKHRTACVISSGAGRDSSRAVESSAGHSVRSVIGGLLIDPNISAPLPFAGISYVNLNLFNKGAQLNVFFGGAYGQASWSVPAIAGTRWQVHGDGVGIAVSIQRPCLPRRPRAVL